MIGGGVAVILHDIWAYSPAILFVSFETFKVRVVDKYYKDINK